MFKLKAKVLKRKLPCVRETKTTRNNISKYRHGIAQKAKIKIKKKKKNTKILNEIKKKKNKNKYIYSSSVQKQKSTGIILF